MTNEKIGKAVNEYIGYPPEMDEGIETTMRRNAFKDGANWRINSVWHKPEEVPEANEWIIHLDRFGYRVDVILPSVIQHWEFLVADKGITRWAYIDDLIPTEDETA